jgi:hypothetical protein
VSVASSDQFRSATVAVDLDPAGAGAVVIDAANVSDVRISGDGVQCPAIQVVDAAAHVRCTVVGDGSFTLTVQIGFADTSRPVPGSVALEETPAPDSAGFTARP